ncbi:hypothetical protein SELMODRAFT_412408 [Selaginella moellendorffii]|uniref:RRM domain-containing protein n=1 Tax=Selaginella moellendorffii TaxID=88036 RepID=D8RL21_SELML|nr:hypothetical protein SELMODRAFT_412408 [Selaginella moellendorffii]
MAMVEAREDWGKTSDLAWSSGVAPWSVLIAGLPRNSMTSQALQSLAREAVGGFEMVPDGMELVNFARIFSPPGATAEEDCAVVGFSCEAVAELFLDSWPELQLPHGIESTKLTFARNFRSSKRVDSRQEIMHDLVCSAPSPLEERFVVYVSGLPEEWIDQARLRDYFAQIVKEYQSEEVVRSVHVSSLLKDAYVELTSDVTADLVFYRSKRDRLLDKISKEVFMCRGVGSIPLLHWKLPRIKAAAAEEASLKNGGESEKKATFLDFLKNQPGIPGKALDLNVPPPLASNPETAPPPPPASSPKAAPPPPASTLEDAPPPPRPASNRETTHLRPRPALVAAPCAGRALKVETERDDANFQSRAANFNVAPMQRPCENNHDSAMTNNDTMSVCDSESVDSFQRGQRSRNDSLNRSSVFVGSLAEHNPTKLKELFHTLLRKSMPLVSPDSIRVRWARGKSFCLVGLRSEKAAQMLMDAYMEHTRDAHIPGFPLAIYRHRGYQRPGTEVYSDSSVDESGLVLVQGLPPRLHACLVQGALTELLETALAGARKVRFKSRVACEHLLTLKNCRLELAGGVISLEREASPPGFGDHLDQDFMDGNWKRKRPFSAEQSHAKQARQSYY